MDWSTVREWILAVAAFGGLWIAYQGLHTWQAQLTGSAAHAASVDLIRAALVFRAEVESLRSPLIPSLVAAESTREERYQAMQREYRRAVARVETAWTEVRVASIKMQAVHPANAEEVRARERVLFDRLVVLRFMVSGLLSVRPEALDDRSWVLSRATSEGLAVPGGGKADSFAEGLDSEIEDLIAILGKHMER